MSEFFIALLNRSLLVSCMLLAVAVIRLIFPKTPRRAVMYGWTWIWLSFLLPSLPKNPRNILPTATVIKPEILFEQTPTVNTGIPAVNQVVNPVISESFAPSPGASVNPLQIIVFALAVIWIIGMVGMMIHGVFSYIMLRRRVADAVLWKENIYESEKVKTPFVLGILKPRIYLPFALEEKDRELVVLHEKKHAWAGHPFMKILGYFVLCVYWFCPVCWLGYHLFGKDMELECDELVLKEIGEERKKEYAGALLNCSTMHQHLGTCPVAFGEVGARFRIKNILKYKKSQEWKVFVSFALMVLFMYLFIGEPMEWNSVPEQVDYITDGRADWNNVTEVTLYADGYFGRTLEEPLVIADEKIVGKLVTMITEQKDYGEVPQGNSLEGLYTVFAAFDNGVVVCMYRHGHYGTLSDKIQGSGGQPYYLPEEFCDEVCRLLEDNYPKATIDTRGVLVPSDEIDHFLIWDGITGEGVIYQRNVIQTYDEILHRYENLEFVPFETAEDSAPQFSEYTYCIEVYGKKDELLQTVIPKGAQIYIDGVMYDCTVSDSLQLLDAYVKNDLWFDHRWREFETLKAAENTAGFSLGMTETIAGSYVAESYRVLEGGVLEVVYRDQEYEVCVRKMLGTDKDCSGDHTQYAQVETIERDGGTVTFYRNENAAHISKTVVSYNGYSWSLVTPNGFWGDSAEEFLKQIF